MSSFDDQPDLYKQNRKEMADWAVNAGRLNIDGAARRIVDIRHLLNTDYEFVRDRSLEQTKRDIESLVRDCSGPEGMFATTANIMVVRGEYGEGIPPAWDICFIVGEVKGVE
jgi:hypothetical protein